MADAGRGSGGVLFVSGEAGVGKSRLVSELVTTAREAGLQVLFGRAVRADVRRCRSGRSPRPCSPTSAARACPTYPDLVAVPARTGPAAARVADTPAETTHEPPVVLAEGVVRLLTAVAGDGATLLVIEDIHWADQETLAVLEYFADVLAHPAGPVRRHRAVARRPSHGATPRCRD